MQLVEVTEKGDASCNKPGGFLNRQFRCYLLREVRRRVCRRIALVRMYCKTNIQPNVGCEKTRKKL
jgi:hypothetical protein